MELSAVNSRENVSDLAATKPAKRRMLAALSQLARLANSQNLRALLPGKPCVFSKLQMATALHHQIAALEANTPGEESSVL
jgi:hypothetical protein